MRRTSTTLSSFSASKNAVSRSSQAVLWLEIQQYNKSGVVRIVLVEDLNNNTHYNEVENVQCNFNS